MKNIFYKFAGTILSASLIFTGLNLSTASVAFAEDEFLPPENNISEQEANYASIQSINIVDETNSLATVEVKLDKNIEDTDMPLFVYEEGTPYAIDEISSGGNVIQFNIQKEASSKNIYVVTGENTSNIVIIGEFIHEIQEFELTSDKIFLKNTGPTPTLMWDTYDTDYWHLPVFVADSDGKIVFSDDYYNYYSIPRFYQEKEMSYTAYVADNSLESETISDLTNIKMMSNTVTIRKEEWFIDLSINDSYTSDSKAILSWTTNDQNNDYYSAYLVDETNGQIIETIYFNEKKDHMTLEKLPYSEQEIKLAIYASKRNDNATNVSELEEIQTKSNIVSTKHAPFELTARADKTVPYTYEDYPLILWETNQTLDGTPYGIYAFNLNESGQMYDYGSVESSGEFSIGQIFFNDLEDPLLHDQKFQKYLNDYTAGIPLQYKVYIAKSGQEPVTEHDLVDIIEESEIITIARGAWDGNAMVVPSEEKNKIVWNLNQPNNDFVVSLIDKETGTIIEQNEAGSKQTEFKLINGEPSWFDGDYKIILSYGGYGEKTYNDLSALEYGIIAELEVKNKLLPPKWYIDLSYNPITGNNNEYRFNISTNRSTYNSDYGVYVTQDSDGKIIHKYSGEETNNKFDFSVGENSSETYTAYIADLNNSAENYSDLTNIIATSKSIYPRFIPSTGDYKPTGGRFGGGFNPSSTDCQQQCYGDPINNYTGEYFESSEDLSVDAISPLALTRSYSTFKKDEIGPFGLGGTTNYNMQLVGEFDSLEDSDNIRFIQENGSISDFLKTSDGAFIASENTEDKLSKVDNNYVITRKSNEKFTFDSSGKLIKISDIFDNTTTLTYTNENATKATSDDGKYIQINYNSNDLINSITDGRRTINYTYDTQKRLINVKSYKAINSKKYSYDSQNRVSQITQPNGGVYKNNYDTNNRVIKQTDPLSNETQFQYNEIDGFYETIITQSDGTVKEDKYDLYGRLVSEIFNRNGIEQLEYTYQYGSSGNISRTEDPSGKATKYIYDESGNISAIIDNLGRTTRFTYNKYNQVVEKINPYGKKTTNTYDEKGILISTKDSNGNTTEYETNDKGRLIKITQPEQVGKNSPKSEKIVYDTNGFISQNISPEGEVQKTTNNSLGLPVKFTDPYNSATTIAYTSQFNISKKTYPNGTFETYTYDNASRLIKHTDTLGNESTYSYDLMDNITSFTNAFGTTKYKYDSNQRLIETIEPNLAKTSYKYDNFGQIIEIKNAEGNISKLTYDDSGNIVSETDFNNNLTEYEYDSINNLIYKTDANNGITAYSYDRLNRLIKIETPNAYTEEYKYDNVGNLVRLNKNNIDSISYSYDKNNNSTKTTYQDSSTVENTYNANNSLISFKNRDNEIVSYKYDLNERLIETTRSDNSKESVKYNSMGNILQISYDNWASIDTEYEYNTNGQLTKATNNNNETTYAYDAIGQLTSRGPPSSQVGYSYDDYGRLNQINYPSNKTVEYSYNLFNNINSVTIDEETIVDYEYDNNGNTLNEYYGNNTERNNTYDSLNRLDSFEILNSESSLYNRSLIYDETHLIQNSSTFVEGSLSEDKEFSYSQLEKIEEIYDYESGKFEEYSIDNYSNIIESSIHQNKLTKNGQLTSSFNKDTYTSYTYTYDERGNRLSKSNEYDSEKIDYNWTSNNKLKSLNITNYDEYEDETSEINIDYTYDASGLLKSRSKNNSKTDDYVWDTTSSVPLLLEDGKNSYIYGNDSAPIAQINKTSGSITYLHGDERGSIVLATNSNGNSLLTREYDAYGNHVENAVISPSNPATNPFTTNFAYAGEYQDKDSGLYNLRARWYEPLTGTFINQDPALMATGEAYSYASGNPLSFTDPLGLYSTAITPSDSAGGNIAAGFVDGLIGYPVVHKISNYIKPGSVSNCGPGYKVSGYAGMATGFLIPGGAAVKGTTMALKGAGKGAAAVGKINKADDGLETVWRHGKIKERIDTTGMPRFNAQNPAFGEAAQHNADVLQGQKWLLQREIGDKKQIRKNRYHNTKQLKGKKYGYEKDEVPPASTMESRNHDSSVRFILAKDNNAHGTSLGAFYKKNNISPGDWFIYE